MSHTALLLIFLSLAWLLAAAIMRLVPRFERWGDRRALHQLALWSPFLAVILSGGWSAQMALSGCLMFTTADGLGTLALMGGLLGMLTLAGVHESGRSLGVRRQLEVIAQPLDATGWTARVETLARKLGVKAPALRLIETDRPFACVAGVRRPSLYVSRWMLEALTEPELEGLLAHELAHLRHQDNLLAWLGIILLRTFRFLPPLRQAWQEGLAEREEAADAQASAVTGRPLELASALLRVAQQGQALPSVAGLSAFHAEGALLERRVERLLAAVEGPRRSWGVPAIAALCVGLALPFLTAAALGYATSCLLHPMHGACPQALHTMGT